MRSTRGWCSTRGIAFLLGAVLASGTGCGDSSTGQPDGSSGTGSIAGLVTGQDGTPIGGVEIATVPPSGFAVSNADGDYSLSGLAPGSYQVTATRAGYLVTEKSADVTAGGTAYVDFTLEAEVVPGAIAGHVTDSQSGAPLAGVTVTTDPATGTATSGVDGAFSLAGLAPGSYSVLASLSGYEGAQAGPATVAAGQTTTLDLQLVAIVVYPTTCAGCHVSTANLLADLEADPPPPPPEGGSEGEG